MTVTLFGLEKITGPLSKFDLNVLHELFPGYDVSTLQRESTEVDILLGVKQSSLHPSHKLRKAGDNLFIMEGQLGTCLYGSHPRVKLENGVTANSVQMLRTARVISQHTIVRMIQPAVTQPPLDQCVTIEEAGCKSTLVSEEKLEVSFKLEENKNDKLEEEDQPCQDIQSDIDMLQSTSTADKFEPPVDEFKSAEDKFMSTVNVYICPVEEVIDTDEPCLTVENHPCTEVIREVKSYGGDLTNAVEDQEDTQMKVAEGNQTVRLLPQAMCHLGEDSIVVCCLKMDYEYQTSSQVLTCLPPERQEVYILPELQVDDITVRRTVHAEAMQICSPLWVYSPTVYRDSPPRIRAVYGNRVVPSGTLPRITWDPGGWMLLTSSVLREKFSRRINRRIIATLVSPVFWYVSVIPD